MLIPIYPLAPTLGLLSNKKSHFISTVVAISFILKHSVNESYSKLVCELLENKGFLTEVSILFYRKKHRNNRIDFLGLFPQKLI